MRPGPRTIGGVNAASCPFLPRAADALASSAVARDPGVLALFEARGQLTSEGPPGGVFDGGCRFEPLDGAAGRWGFAAGLGASGLDALAAGAAWPERARAEWDAAIDALRDALRAAPAARTARAVADSLAAPGAEVRTAVFGRVRAWSRAGAVHAGPLELGIGVSARWRDPGGVEVGPDLLLGADPLPAEAERAARGWVEARGAALAAAAGRGALPAGGRPGEPYEGPLVLHPDAAAWLAHELAHAALEDLVGGRPTGWSLLDDPAAAPWPAGFDVDDAGGPAGARDLFDRGTRAARRRGSVREAALPALSATRLEFAPGAPRVSVRELGTAPALLDCRSGRLDPPSASVVLEGRLAERADEPADDPAQGLVTVVLRLEEGWPDLHALADLPRGPAGTARCARGGSLLRVMVGAPTLMLTRAQVWPRETRAARGGRRFRAR